MDTTWLLRTFDELTVRQLYAITALRERVFVVEQRCAYLDADGLDPGARHLWAERGGDIVAYLRILPAGAKYEEVVIGRVVTAREGRGGGLGRELMRRGIEACGNVPIRISAQAHLEEWYRQLGFTRASEIYDEDGIAHIDMLRTP
jgi:ElaA protein